MALPLWLGPAIKGATSVGGYLTNLFNKPKPFRATSYAKRLKEIMKSGIIPQAQKRIVVGNLARTTGNIAQAEKAGYRGRLIRHGYGDSIAGMEKQADIGMEHAEGVGRAGKEIDVKNILSKEQAKTEYAQAKDRYAEGRRKYSRQNIQNLIGGLGGAALDYVQSKTKLDDKNAIPDLLMKAKKGEITPEQLDMELLKLGLKPDEIQALAEMD